MYRKYIVVIRSLGQSVVFQSVGEGLLNNAFCGYNACIFAYGQTGWQISILYSVFYTILCILYYTVYSKLSILSILYSLYYTILYYTILYSLYYTILYSLYCTILYSLYYTILYSLYYTILYSLYYTILYYTLCTILYYTILYYTLSYVVLWYSQYIVHPANLLIIFYAYTDGVF